ncbi:uncharacterized protein LOC143276632 [Babylonia areolata]|uniref:uncharacterized protein LOC143276632 n=1 Tax=Babylonia areolata TaxID=304850 RepID=UPI003FD13193
MVVWVGAARLTVRLPLLLLLLLLPGWPPFLPTALTSSSAINVTSDVIRGTGSSSLQDRQQVAEAADRMWGDGGGEEEEVEERGWGRRWVGDRADHGAFKTEDIQVGCRELRAKRYISDGFCTSVKPLQEVVCEGHCLPIRNLPWYAEFVELWTRSRLLQWRCVEAVVRRKAVHLLCRNGEYRTYRIKVVKSCKCEQRQPQQQKKRNRTNRKKKTKRRRRRKKNKGEEEGGGGGRRRKKKEEGEGEEKRGRGRGGEKKSRKREQEEEEGKEQDVARGGGGGGGGRGVHVVDQKQKDDGGGGGGGGGGKRAEEKTR